MSIVSLAELFTINKHLEESTISGIVYYVIMIIIIQHLANVVRVHQGLKNNRTN